MCKRQGEEPSGDQREAARQQAFLAEAPRQAADQPALQDRRNQPEIGEDITDLSRSPAELRHRPDRKDALHPGDRQDDEKKDQDQPREDRPSQYTHYGGNATARRSAVAPTRREALGQEQSDAEQGEAREPGRDPRRGLEIGGQRIGASEQPAER